MTNKEGVYYIGNITENSKDSGIELAAFFLIQSRRLFITDLDKFNIWRADRSKKRDGIIVWISLFAVVLFVILSYIAYKKHVLILPMSLSILLVVVFIDQVFFCKVRNAEYYDFVMKNGKEIRMQNKKIKELINDGSLVAGSRIATYIILFYLLTESILSYHKRPSSFTAFFIPFLSIIIYLVLVLKFQIDFQIRARFALRNIK